MQLTLCYLPIAIFSSFNIMLGIQNENVICLFKVKVFYKASKEHIHHVHIYLPKDITIIPVNNKMTLINALRERKTWSHMDKSDEYQGKVQPQAICIMWRKPAQVAEAPSSLLREHGSRDIAVICCYKQTSTLLDGPCVAREHLKK